MKITFARLAVFCFFVLVDIVVGDAMVRIDAVDPYVIPADGTQHKIEIDGSGFSRNMSLLLDGQSIPFDFKNSGTVFINVNFSFRGVHFLELINSQFLISEKKIISVADGSFALSMTKGPTNGGSFLNIFSLNPGFEPGATVSFANSSGSASAQSVILISPNELEVVTPSFAEGPVSVAVHSPIQGDMILQNAFNFEDSAQQGTAQTSGSIASQLVTVGTCSIGSFTILDSYMGWRRFKANLTGCCSPTACNTM